MVKIILAENKHVKDILSISKQAFTAYQNALPKGLVPVALTETEQGVIDDIKNKIVLAALENNVVKGSIRIEQLSKDLCYLYRFSVDASDQNSGIGSEILQAAIEKCRSLGASAIALHTNSKYFKLARYYYGKEFYVHSTTTDRGYIRALFVKDLNDKKVDFSKALTK